MSFECFIIKAAQVKECVSNHHLLSGAEVSFIPVRKELGEGTSSDKGGSHLLRPFPGKVVNPQLNP